MKRYAVLLVVALLATVPAAASTFVGLTHDELVEQSHSVVIARVVQQSSAWSDDGRVIWTDNILAIEETIIGKAAGHVTVRTAGGQVGDYVVEASGFPKFESNEHVLLFLHHDAKAGATRVLGFQQGHFSIVERLDGVVLAVPMVEDGATLMGKNGHHLAAPTSLPLEQFKQQIRATAARLDSNRIEK